MLGVWVSGGRVCATHKNAEGGWQWRWCCFDAMAKTRPPCPAAPFNSCAVYVSNSSYHVFFRGENGLLYEYHTGEYNGWTPDSCGISECVRIGMRHPKATCDPALIVNDRGKRLFFTAEDNGVWELNFSNDIWSTSRVDKMAGHIVGVLPGSCLAAIGLKDSTHIFYFDGSGNLQELHQGTYNNWNWQGYSIGQDLNLPAVKNGQISYAQGYKTLVFIHDNEIYNIHWEFGHWVVNKIITIIQSSGRPVPPITVCPKVFMSEFQQSLVTCSTSGIVLEFHRGSYNAWKWELMDFVHIQGEPALDTSGLCLSTTKHIFYRSKKNTLCELHCGEYNKWNWQFWCHADPSLIEHPPLVHCTPTFVTYQHSLTPLAHLPIMPDEASIMCKVCYAAPITLLLLECMHQICGSCGKGVSKREPLCPLCKKSITSIATICDATCDKTSCECPTTTPLPSFPTPLRTSSTTFTTPTTSTSTRTDTATAQGEDLNRRDASDLNQRDSAASSAAARPPPGILTAAETKTPSSSRILDSVDEVLSLRDYLRFPPGFTPSSVETELLSHESQLQLPMLQYMVKTCKLFVRDLSSGLPVSLRSANLTEDDLLAITLYTFDLGMAAESPKDNLYFALNDDLRQRKAQKMAAWRGYLFHLLSALAKLPAVVTTVYRGVRQPSVDSGLRSSSGPSIFDSIRSEYRLGRLVRWTGFSSSTTSLNVAKYNFAGTGTTEGGVVFRLSILTGRDLCPLSYVRCEDEILLSPNTTFIVQKALHYEADMAVVDLQEICDEQYVF
ncbi:hypothetical protein Pelo_10451 [Pelomyxa schiedti]|nr:hypothetical protein Pelo_10451 [Pelomyxa schiedti]